MFDLAMSVPFFEMLNNKGLDVRVRDLSGKAPSELGFDGSNITVTIDGLVTFTFTNNEFASLVPGEPS